MVSLLSNKNMVACVVFVASLVFVGALQSVDGMNEVREIYII